jgi:hypothetical protein
MDSSDGNPPGLEPIQTPAPSTGLLFNLGDLSGSGLRVPAPGRQEQGGREPSAGSLFWRPIPRELLPFRESRRHGGHMSDCAPPPNLRRMDSGQLIALIDTFLVGPSKGIDGTNRHRP